MLKTTGTSLMGSRCIPVWKSEDPLNVWSCCKRKDFFVKEKDGDGIEITTYIIKGPVIFQLQCVSDDMIWDEMTKKYWEPMLRSFQPIVEIT